MLQLTHLKKQYKTGSLVQTALNDVSLNLRKNEFVAILGPSGSGKTTLLNVIGGLDRYDSGDLLIDGVSTKYYSDRDWDTYRNHTIGFVFQSYNLIPHQTVLANVELALTISGVSRAERRRRAQRALERVGLGEQSHKRPGEMSGGQMQRVAIARALVNDPQIVLADEPTGALDSETGVQVMELLKEVARDRLVVMVTHNPELAERYATRIVKLCDGKITSDTMPFDAPREQPAAREKKRKKASMSILTALMLSFNNLRTKKARTFLTSFAGSIGIIGIALILSISNGVNAYIKSVESETLASYPLQIQSSGFDMSGMMAGSTESGLKSEKISVRQTITGMLSGVSVNDLAALKRYFDDGGSGIEDVTTAVEYRYNVTPQIYRADADGYRQVHPDTTFAALGMGSGSTNSLLSSMMSTDVFHVMPAEPSLYRDAYEVRAGRWPQSYRECVVVLTPGGSISDFTMYTLGLRDAVELDELIRRFLSNESIDEPEQFPEFSCDDLLNIQFRLLDRSELYVYDADYGLWRDRADDEAARNALLATAETLTVVGVVRPKEDGTALLPSGIAYPAELTAHVAQKAALSEIVRQQLAAPSVNVFTGKVFSDNTSAGRLDLSTLFSVDTDKLAEAFRIDESKLDVDLSSIFSGVEPDFTSLMGSALKDLTLPELPAPDLSALLRGLDIRITPENMDDAAAVILAAYRAYIAAHPEADYARLGDYFLEYLTSEEGQARFAENLEKILAENGALSFDPAAIQALLTELMKGYWDSVGGVVPEDPEAFAASLREYLETEQAQEILREGAKKLFAFGEGVKLLPEQLRTMAEDLYAGYRDYAAANGTPDPENFQDTFPDFLNDPATRQALLKAANELINLDSLKAQLSKAVRDYMEKTMQTVSEALVRQLEERLGAAAEAAMGQLADGLQESLKENMGELAAQLGGALSVDADAMMSAFRLNMDESSLAALLDSLTRTADDTLKSNLKTLGYADPDEPDEIRIYPRDFAAKAEIVNILNAYNEHVKALGQDDKVIRYTDMVGMMMSSVTQIVDIISYVLVAFVAISLVVSSIMIGVITYISVMERRKEIGILRAIGASKRNISEVFNAETFIVGLLAGLIGIGMTLLLLIPANALIHSLSGEQNLNAVLPLGSSVILIALSVLLTILGGLIPAKGAARSDPVAALRSE